MSSAEEGVAPKSGGAAHRYPGARNPEFRRVLVTGANGKVGVRVVQAFHKDSSGKPWEVVATDVSRGVFDTPGADDPWNYQQADLTDAGEVFSMVARFQPDAVVHIAAIPDIEHNAPHTVFANNITATFNGACALRCIRGACVRSPATANSCCAVPACGVCLRRCAVVEACVMFGVPRLVNISSEQAPGFFSNNGPPGGAVCHPKYCPVDEEHPMTPNNPYSLSKSFGEQICDAAVRRTAGSTNLAVISIRPSWCSGCSAPTAPGPFISAIQN